MVGKLYSTARRNQENKTIRTCSNKQTNKPFNVAQRTIKHMTACSTLEAKSHSSDNSRIQQNDLT